MNNLQNDTLQYAADIFEILRYVHTMPRGTQRQSVARPRGKSCAVLQVYVDVASAWLRHAVRCCVAYKFDRQIVGPIKRTRAAYDE